MKNKLLLTFALLLTAVTGAWATDWYKVQVTVSGTMGGSPIAEQSFTQYSTLPYEKTLGECYQAVTGNDPSLSGLTVSGATLTSGDNITVGALSNWNTSITITAAGNATVTTTLTAGGYPAGTVYFAIAVEQVTSWVSGDCTVLKDGSSIIVRKTDPSSETGAMADYASIESRGWHGDRNNITSIVIGSGVTSIGDDAFEDCSNLASVTMGNNVTSIGAYAFYGCTSLATVTFEANSHLTTIGFNAFYDCYNLTSVTIPASVESIGASAFGACDNLATVTFEAGSHLTSIGAYAFYDCNNLATVTLNSNPYIGTDAFIKDGLSATPTVTMNLTANTAGGAKWMTFYNKLYSFEADENTQVFKAERSGTTITLHEVANRIVDAATPVILKSSGNPVMTLTATSSGDTQNNSLAGVSNPAGTTSDGTMFVLNNGSAGVGFYKLTSGKTLGVGKAYLTYTDALSNFFGIDEETTAISEELRVKSEELKSFYDLSGRKVEKPTKGLYIVNGKKVVKR